MNTLFDGICEVVCKGEETTMNEIKRNNRDFEILYPRQVIMYLAKEFKVGSLAAIGNVFGKDHATVLNSWKSIQNYIDTDRIKRDKISIYKEKLSGVKKVLEMNETLEREIVPIKDKINELERRLLTLRISIDNIQNFIQTLKL